MLDVGVEDHSLLGSYRSSHLKLTRDFILGFGPYPVLYFYPEKPREMQSSGMSMSPAVETSHPPLAHPPGDGTDLHPTPAVDVPIYETPLWPSRPQCLGVRFTVAEMPMGFAMSRAWSSNHSRRDVILLLNCDVLAHPMRSQRIRLLRSNMVRQLQHCVREKCSSRAFPSTVSRERICE